MRARLQIRVVYDAPASNCGRVLHILPLARPSIQAQEHLDIFPPPDSQSEDLDPWNNRRLRVFHRRIEREFGLNLEIEARNSETPVPLESLNGLLKMPSRAAPFAPELGEIARAHRVLAPLERARTLNRLVFESLAYSSQTSERPDGAGQIWHNGRGSCADFAHVLLALCRASGLPARYVAGFGPAPGALHAWVEVAFDGAWHAFDPTHGREARGLYLPVAIGRDFYDCAPHQGRFRGQGARLELRCELQAIP
jgi:transglutaminase-like putative cysteine protease